MKFQYKAISSIALLLVTACDVEQKTPAPSGIDLGEPDSGSESPAKTTNSSSSPKPPSSASNVTPNSSSSGITPISSASSLMQTDSGALQSDGGANPVQTDSGASPEQTDGGTNSEAVYPRPARRGFYVVESDYASVNVSVYNNKGQLRATSLISSGSSNVGLSAALSSDVIPSTSSLTGNAIVLMDRTNNTLSWVNLETTDVTQQVNVGPGDFAANPYDYVPYDAHRAFVTRSQLNGHAGTAAFDTGGDILVLDPTTGALTDEIDLSSTFDQLPATGAVPNRAVMAGGLLRVTAIGHDGASYATGRLISIDPETLEVVDVHLFPGLQNCNNLAVSPDGQSLALACWGPFPVDLQYSGIAVVSAERAPQDLAIVHSAELGNAAIDSLEFTSNTTVAYTTFGDFNAAGAAGLDSLRLLDVTTATADTAAIATSTGGAYALGEIRCIPESETCVLTDASSTATALRRFHIEADGRLSEETAVTEADGLLMPPRYIGVY